ncbi:MAG: reductive dehalogenase [Bacteroidetes bacterium]|nr:MAG: reductive dehalogenase [Bacteroidota bacterium]RLD83322.1 MAG: reductive dehalogenase [Bacteroidota bacterium]
METIFLILINVLIFIFTIVGIVFILEKESRPAFFSFLLALLFILLNVVFNYFDPSEKEFFTYGFVGVSVIVFLFLIIPFKNRHHKKPGVVLKQFDERNVMFSRNELKPGTDKFKDYYQQNSDKKALDDKFRDKPGLLSKNASKYHPFKFASAEANFMAVEAFVPFLKENIHSEKQTINPVEISNYLKSWAKQIGAISIGITDLKENHLYSIKGRGEEYGNKIVQNHQFAIAFTVEMDKEMLDLAPEAETIIESSQQYLASANIAIQIALFIRNLGYTARPHFDGNYQVICPVVAKDAGLGEFGRMGLLMTPELGPRVRIGVITTDIPLITDNKKYEPSVTDFCTICRKCADNCPTRAISFENMKELDGVLRWKINHEACFTYWNIIGTDCGKCIQVCPYSHPNNLMHNLVRKGIKNSNLFRKFALQMDDLFYGRKPSQKNRKSPVEN